MMVICNIAERGDCDDDDCTHFKIHEHRNLCRYKCSEFPESICIPSIINDILLFLEDDIFGVG